MLCVPVPTANPQLSPIPVQLSSRHSWHMSSQCYDTIIAVFYAWLGWGEQSKEFEGFIPSCICNWLPTCACRRESSKSLLCLLPTLQTVCSVVLTVFYSALEVPIMCREMLNLTIPDRYTCTRSRQYIVHIYTIFMHWHTGWPNAQCNPREGTSVVLRDTIRLTWWCV